MLQQRVGVSFHIISSVLLFVRTGVSRP